jgi:hypothetical protein
VTLLALFLALNADASKLGSEDFRTREVATHRLKAAGPLAVPFLAAACRSESPETRARAARLLAPARAGALELRARDALFGPFPPDTRATYADVEMRARMLREAARHGYDGESPVYDHYSGYDGTNVEANVYWLRPEADVTGPFAFWFGDPLVDFGRRLRDLRRQLGSASWLLEG